jgi:hypothetical protein
MQLSRLFFATGFCSAAASTTACGHAAAEMPLTVQASMRAPAPEGAASPPTAAVSAPAALAPMAEPTEAADPYATATPISAKSIGHTSYVLKVTLEGGLAAAYKPASTLPLGRHRYKAEIAAYRLARALGLENVPRAIPRAFSAAALHDTFPTPQGATDFGLKAIVDPAGLVHGALIPWINDYRVLPLEEPSWRARWESWLMNPEARIPDAEEGLAASISTMLVFDYITANWDRWSGGNVARAGADGVLLFVDNDGAFYEHPAQEPLAAQLARIRRVARFSQSFVSALQGLDDAKLRAAFGDEAPGTPLLSDPVIAAVESRLRKVLGVIDACARREWIE